MMNEQKIVGIHDLSPLLLEMLSEGHPVRLKITGNSMYPLLRNRRDSVLLEQVRPEDLHKYDIALYRREDGNFVVHRVVKIKQGIFTMNGDNQLFLEHPILPSQIHGVVRGFYRDEKFLSCSCWWYRIYKRAWVLFRPFRRPIFLLARWVKNVGGQVEK